MRLLLTQSVCTGGKRLLILQEANPFFQNLGGEFLHYREKQSFSSSKGMHSSCLPDKRVSHLALRTIGTRQCEICSFEKISYKVSK